MGKTGGPVGRRYTGIGKGFTLLELLVVVAVIGVLIAITLPALSAAKRRAQATKCLANLHAIGQGLVTYSLSNDGFAVPSYNMPRWGTYMAQAGDVVDGWPAILDHDGYVPASQGLKSNVFYCPNTEDVYGMADGQTLYDQQKPQGFQDWPIQFITAGGDSSPKQDPVLPIAGFGISTPYMHNIRCSYFLNAQNPISGTAPTGATVPPCPYYTQSVGYGPYKNGQSMPLVKTTSFVRPGALIVATDGIYMGRQSVTRIGEQNRRVGYRHPGPGVTVNAGGDTYHTTLTVSNAVFADGHAEGIRNSDMPHGNVPSENGGPYSFINSQ
jgi:prepilin-type N-terminal cleavage/methylation domain-containing protein/prepilin-type processing-associated H-X9-DG protein